VIIVQHVDAESGLAFGYREPNFTLVDGEFNDIITQHGFFPCEYVENFGMDF
jgi:hypothetical protein